MDFWIFGSEFGWIIGRKYGDGGECGDGDVHVARRDVARRGVTRLGVT